MPREHFLQIVIHRQFQQFYLPLFQPETERERERSMASSSFSPLSQFSSTSFTVCERPTNHKKKIQIGCTLKLTSSTGSSFPLPSCQVLHKSLPLAASVVVLLWSNPGNQIDLYSQLYFISLSNIDIVLVCNKSNAQISLTKYDISLFYSIF